MHDARVQNKAFNKWASSEEIAGEALWNAAIEIVDGRVEADLGGCLYKKRLPRAGSGKSGGYRTLIGYRKGNSDRVVFLYGFPKNKKANVTAKEQAALSLVARKFVEASDTQIQNLIDDKGIFELEKPDE